MLGNLPPFDYYQPATLEEALALIKRLDGKVGLLAGGTDLLVAMKERKLNHRALLDIKHIPELCTIRPDDGGLIRPGGGGHRQCCKQCHRRPHNEAPHDRRTDPRAAPSKIAD